MRVSVFIATSLDGFIARADGGLDWLPGGDAPGDEGSEAEPEDHGFEEFFASVDALLMGRNTFDKVVELLAEGEQWYYGAKPVHVLTHRALEAPDAIRERVRAIAGAPADVLAELAAAGLERIYLDGGLSIQAFLREDLVDDLRIFRMPVLIGSGIPLFGALEHDIRLELVRARSLSGGIVECEYRVTKS